MGITGTVPRLSGLPPRSPQAAGSSTGITSTPASGWRPDIPSMPSDIPSMPSPDPTELRTSPYPSRHSVQRDPTTDTTFEQHLESLNSPLDIPFDVTTPSAQSQPADIAPSSQARLTSVPKVRSRRVPAVGHQNQHTLKLARLAAANSASKRAREAPTSGSGSSDDMFPPSPIQQTFRLRSLYGNPPNPEQMEVSDQDDPQPLPPSPTVLNTDRFRFRSLIDMPCDSGTSGSEYQPDAGDLSNSMSDSAREGLPTTVGESGSLSRADSDVELDRSPASG